MQNPELSRRSVLAGAAAVVGVSALGAPAAARTAPRAPTAIDAVIVGGTVLSMDHRFTRAEAVAVRGGKVVATGTYREISRLAGRGTRVIDAAGGTVLPGINDSHLHLGGMGLSLPPLSYDVDTATIEELQAVVAAATAATPSSDSWIRGRGWNENRLPRTPTRHDLDAVSGNHPVMLNDFSQHMVVVNSLVLQMAGVNRDSVPPTGGVIEKDAAGEPTGVLRETAQQLIAQVVPPFTPEETAAGVDAAVRVLHAVGITSITEPGIGLDQLALYEAKAREGALPLRITALLAGGTSVGGLRSLLDAYVPVSGVDPLNLRVAGVKLFGDGIPTAAQTAYLHEPYVDGSNGAMVFEGSTVAEQVATLNELVRLANARGMQVGTHATGDATIDHVVAAYLASQGNRWRQKDLRNYVIHADLTRPGTLRTMAANGIGANMNATIKFLLGRTLDANLGPERVDYQWPYRTALDVGVQVTSASDAPVTPPSWLLGVMAARLREGMFGGVAGEAQRITVPEALATYTRTPAWQDHAERYKGTLTPGMVADMTIVGGDVLGADPHALVDMPVTHTVLGGEVVFEAGSGSPTAREAGAAVAALGSRGHREHAVATLQAGGCCCSTNDKLLHRR